jgi:hypothetical protein
LRGVFGSKLKVACLAFNANGERLATDDASASSKFYGQATKGAWWMPWQKTAMKDVVSCDKPRGAANRH